MSDRRVVLAAMLCATLLVPASRSSAQSFSAGAVLSAGTGISASATISGRLMATDVSGSSVSASSPRFGLVDTSTETTDPLMRVGPGAIVDVASPVIELERATLRSGSVLVMDGGTLRADGPLFRSLDGDVTITSGPPIDFRSGTLQFDGLLAQLAWSDGTGCFTVIAECLRDVADGSGRLPFYELFPAGAPVTLTDDRPDLPGQWRFFGLEASTTVDAHVRALQGQFTIGGPGRPSIGTGRTSRGDSIRINGVALSADGEPVRWLLNGARGQNSLNWLLEGAEIPGTGAVIGPGSVLDARLDVTPAWLAVLPPAVMSFTRRDVAGDWEIYGVGIVERGGASTPIDGHLTIDDLAPLSGMVSTPAGTARARGRVSIARDGGLGVTFTGPTGQWRIDGAVLDRGSSAIGIARGSGGGIGLVALVRPPKSEVPAEFLEGQWRVSGVSFLEGSGIGTSFGGTVTLDASGRFLDGELVDFAGNWFPLNGYQLRVDPYGSVEGGLSTEAFDLRVSGRVASSDMVVLRATIYRWPDGYGSPPSVATTGFMTLLRQPGVPATDSPRLGVVITGSGSGTVRSDSEESDCGEPCMAASEAGATVTLTATPDASSVFTGWTGACTGLGPCTLSMSETRYVTATFRLVATARLTVRRHGQGTITSDSGRIDCGSDCSASSPRGSTVSLTAVAAPGFAFTGWRGACAGTEGCVVTMDRARAVTAIFTRGGSGPGSGSVEPGGAVISASGLIMSRPMVSDGMALTVTPGGSRRGSAASVALGGAVVSTRPPAPSVLCFVCPDGLATIVPLAPGGGGRSMPPTVSGTSIPNTGFIRLGDSNSQLIVWDSVNNAFVVSSGSTSTLVAPGGLLLLGQ